ncbi:amidohydrolase [Alkalicella caledoniensis]|uniref:Amidohydrolase n=1 Tax=Alkalicella caledoniensis TaxID=2731377 RepID=A0A7G9WAG1_ALKCA|nr:amidohydrolase [Alkalicella caledoniensis]QNO15673.1 amidohydrolase [Alkalicella caledoniensis]
MESVRRLFHGKGIINGDGELMIHDCIYSENGVIVDIGFKEDMFLRYKDVPVDSYSGYIYPGFIDCHIHLTGTAVDMLSVDCRKVATMPDLFELIFERIASSPSSALIYCSYFDPDSYLEKGYPTLDLLDTLFPNNPVFISHIECHGGVVNTKFKEICIHPMDDIDGLIVGEYNSKARQFVFNMLGDEYKLKGLKMAEEEAIRQGVTTIHAMEGGQLFSDNDVELILNNIDKFSVDLVVYHQTLDVEVVKERGLKQMGGCVLIDGSSGVYTAALTEPYRLQPDKKGLLYFDKSQIENLVLNAQEQKIQVALHCCGDRGLDFLMDCFEEVNKKDPISSFRHRIEHFEIPRPDQIKRCKELGVVLSMQPSFDYFWGGPAGDYFYTLGERWLWTNPIGKVIEEGIIVGGGSDSGVTPISPLLGIHSAVNHNNPHMRIKPGQGIKMYTKNAAYLTFDEGIKGDIKKGMRTNLTILKENILELEKSSIKDVNVLDTIVAGKKLFNEIRHKTTFMGDNKM